MTRNLPLLITAFALLLSSWLTPPAQAQRVDWATMLPDDSRMFLGDLTSLTTTDRAGNTYVLGCFADTLTIGTTTLRTGTPGQGGQSLYLVKYDSAQRPLWVKQSYTTQPVPSNSVIYGYSLAVDTLNNLYVAGQFSGPFRLDSFAFNDPWPRNNGTFLARLDARTGTARWVRFLTTQTGNSGQGRMSILHIATDNSGDCLFIGHAHQVDSLGELPLTYRDTYDPYVGRIAANGRLRWVRQWRGRRMVSPNYYTPISQGIATDNGGNCVVVGGFTDTLVVDATHTLISEPTSSSGFGFSDAFAVRLDRFGNVAWAKQGYAPYAQAATGVTTDPLGNVLVVVADYHGNGPPTLFDGHTIAGDLNVIKLDGGGAFQWATRIYGWHVVPLVTDQAGNIYLGSVGWGLGLSSLDPAGNQRWVQYPALGSARFNATEIHIDAAQNLYVSAMIDSAVTLGAFQLTPTGPLTGWRPGGFRAAALVRLSPRANQLTGRVFLDTNANGVRDGNETTFPRQVPITAGPGTVYHSWAYNGFNAFVGIGAYDVSLWGVPPHFQLTTPPTGHYTGSFAGYGGQVDNLDFGLTGIPGQTDLRVTVTPYSAARPGRATHYRARVENIGTTTIPADTLVMRLDATATYVGAQPAPSTVAGRVLTWYFPALAPFSSQEYTFAANLATNVAAGTQLVTSAYAAIVGDVDVVNNVDVARQTVTNSLDPNDLTVNYTTLTPAQVAAGQVLDYVIQFQNYGTDTAFSVVIHDSLPAALLRLGTLALVAQSHNVTWMLDGDGHLQLNFPGIELPNRATDVVRSMGFVRFQVRPSAALLPGVLIPNTAHIVFDYNSPLATNGVTTLVLAPNGLVAEAGATAWSLYPNPAADHVTVGGPVGARLAVLDLAGRAVQTAVLDQPTVALADLAPGLYVVRLTLPGGATTSRRLVVR